MMQDKDLTNDVLDEIIAGAKTSMEQYLALSLKAERGAWRKEGPTDDERIMAIEGIIPAADEHVRYEYNAGGGLWIQCSRQKYEKMKAAGMITRMLYERPQSAQQNIPEIIPGGLVEAVNNLLNNDGSRGCYSAIGCGEAREKIELWLAQRQKWESQRSENLCDGNSPVIPDGWVACSERMPEQYDYEIWTYSPTKGVNHSLGYDGHASNFSDGEYYSTIDDVTHWMPITRPAAPQQEVK